MDTETRNVFISYSHEDSTTVLAIKDEIERTGLSCWIDVCGVSPDASDFRHAITSAIRRTDTAFLFFLSRWSQQSEWTQKELDFARDAGKRIVFVRFNDNALTNDVLRFDYARRNQVDWRESEQRNNLLQNLKQWAAEATRPTENDELPPPPPPPSKEVLKDAEVEFEKSMGELNDQQRKAVEKYEGFCRVIAGAGAGKTKTLACRYARLVRDAGVPSKDILCVTFTNKAAEEMRQRIRGLVGPNFNGVIKTFDSFWHDVIVRDCGRLGWPERFGILDRTEEEEILSAVFENCQIDNHSASFKEMFKYINKQKGVTDERGCHPYVARDLLTDDQSPLETEYRGLRTALLKEPPQRKDFSLCQRVCYAGMLIAQRRRTALQFADFVPMVVELFERYPDTLEFWRNRFQYVMVDEFQDVDPGQFDLVRRLCEGKKNLFVVGDDDQSIYSFRGSSPRFILGFEQVFPGTETIVLERNYRSTPQVVEGANTLIARNSNRFQKTLRPSLPSGDAVVCHVADTPNDEAWWIAQKIRSSHDLDGVPYKDSAVLARSLETMQGTLEEALRTSEVPYEVYEDEKFYGRKVVKVSLSYLRLLADHGDDDAFRRCINEPKREIGYPRVRKLLCYAKEHRVSLFDSLRALSSSDSKDFSDDFSKTKATEFLSCFDAIDARMHELPLPDLLSVILEKSGYREWIRRQGNDRIKNDVVELENRVRRFASRYGQSGSLADFLDHVDKTISTGAVDSRDSVKVMTIHRAKGLEFRDVYVCFFNEGIIPDRRSMTPEKLEEERRMAFVAMTRAQKRLFLTASKSQKKLSRFLCEVDGRFLVFDPPIEEGELMRIQPRNQTVRSRIATSFHPQDRIENKVFGSGLVIGVDAQGGTCTVAFDRAGQKTVRMDSLAPAASSPPCADE